MTQFAHITPVPYLDTFAKNRPFHLTLAHLIEQNPAYAAWYAAEKVINPNQVVVMDNGGFEMFKAGLPMYPSDKLLEMARATHADYVVLSDYPAESAIKTIKAAIDTAPKIKHAGLGTFFVPQSKIGDVDDLLYAFQWAANSPHVDYIGVSILSAPNAYGVEKGNKLQRFLSRWKLMNQLDRLGILDNIKNRDKKIHFLGMVDGPNEIMLVEKYLPYIDTWDSSAAVWAGLNGISFDNSPTGLIDGKFEHEVDFSYSKATQDELALAASNVKYIDKLLEKYNR